MNYADYFLKIKQKFEGTDVSDIHEHLAFQFNITDEDCGGIFYAEVKDGELYIEPYEYYDRDAMFISSREVLDQIMEGRLDPVKAYLEHMIQVEGNLDKALKLKDLIEMKNKQQKKAAKKAADGEKKKESVVKKAVSAAKKKTDKKAADKKKPDKKA